MTMIDEETLRRSLADAANEFEISDEAIADILATAARDEAEPRTRFVPPFVRQSGRPRTILAAAAIILVVTAIAVPLLRSEHQSPIRSASTATHETLLPAPSGAQNLTVAPGIVPAIRPAANGEKTLDGKRLCGQQLPEDRVARAQLNLTVARGHIESTFTKLSSLARCTARSCREQPSELDVARRTPFASGTIVLEVPQSSFARFVLRSSTSDTRRRSRRLRTT